jgi:hypothetical protein
VDCPRTQDRADQTAGQRSATIALARTSFQPALRTLMPAGWLSILAPSEQIQQRRYCQGMPRR